MADLLQFPPLLQQTQQSAASLPAFSGQETLTLSDAEAREAALDIRRSWIVEAPAGSGKTGLLIQRFLKLLALGDIGNPREILAITFTRKAAGELRSRVLEQLAEAAAGTPLKKNSGSFERVTRELATKALIRDRELSWQLLASPSGLNIRTIDALCGELAGSLPLLSEGAGSYEPVNDAFPLYEEAARRTLRELGQNKVDPQLDEALRTVLYHRDAQIPDAIRLIAGMLGHREQWGEIVAFQTGRLAEPMLDGPIRARLEQTLERAICAGISRVTRAMSLDLLDDLARFAAHHSNSPGYKEALSPLAVCSGRPKAPGETADQISHWLALAGLVLTQEGEWRKSLAKNTLGLELPKGEKLRLQDLIAELRSEDERTPGLRKALSAVRALPPGRYPDDQWRIVKALFRVLRHAMAELSVLFAERGTCDFTEISLSARTLLRSAPDLLQLPGARLTHLLVDEMQDTSAGQYELIELLTRNWDGATQTVFLVGDPKQSIYLFRQARVARFMRTQATGLLGELSLGALRLTANFRSQAQLVADFNHMFSLILPRPGEARDGPDEEAGVPFVAAEPTRAPGVTPALHWHVRLAFDRGPTGEEPAGTSPQTSVPSQAGDEADAQFIRERIEDFQRRWYARPLESSEKRRPPKMVVLARSRSHLVPLIAEFQRNRGHGALPFRAVEIEPLRERREVLDLLALTRALLHPADRVAWLSVLRSPACGLTLADLLALCGEGLEADAIATVGHLIATRKDRLSPEGQLLLERAWPPLASAHALRGRTDLSTSVERTWRTLGADVLLSPEQGANADRFFHLLRDLEAGPDPLNLSLLQRALGSLYASPKPSPEAVELMTIHKAKGLEWDLVFVPGLERGTAGDQHELLKWLELDGEHGGEAEMILSPIAGKGEESSKLSAWLTGLETAREAAEAKRLLYVACTRAREELHLFATCQRKNDGSLALPIAGSLLRAGWAAAEPAFLDVLSSGSHAAAPLMSTKVIEGPAPKEGSLALAASGEPTPPGASDLLPEYHSTIDRLPADFDPKARFRTAGQNRLPYPPASSLRHAAPFLRPEGSFRARAFGNVLHRYLDLLAQRLARGQTLESLRGELTSWQSRLQTTFRAEGLPLQNSLRESDRTLQALAATLDDPQGRWILLPHRHARSEQALQLSDAVEGESASRTLRADRTFVSGAEPLSDGADTHLWIVDYKTAEMGGRAPSSFFGREKDKYRPQLETYAQAYSVAAKQPRPIMLALYFPLLTHLLYWPYGPESASEYCTPRHL